MNLWLWLGFVASGLVFAFASRSFIDRVAIERPEVGVHTGAETADAILTRPRRLPRIVATESARVLATLARRQSDPSLERRRLIACLAMGVTLICFVLIALGVG